MCSKDFCPLFVYLFFATLNSFWLCWVSAARWKLLGPLDCSLPSLTDLLLTSAESWLHWRRKRQHTPVSLPGESQGWGSWWAAFSGVAQSRTRLKRLSSSSRFIGNYCCRRVFPEECVCVHCFYWIRTYDLTKDMTLQKHSSEIAHHRHAKILDRQILR